VAVEVVDRHPATLWVAVDLVVVVLVQAILAHQIRVVGVVVLPRLPLEVMAVLASSSCAIPTHLQSQTLVVV
jgi:hypothetical protein